MPDVKSIKAGGAVDHIAAASAVMVTGLGVAQVLVPLVATPLTGIENGTAGIILAVQWIVFGAVLAVGGLFRMRVVTIFAAEFLLVAGLAAGAVIMLFTPDPIPLFVHGAVALVGLINSGLARLTDKAELKRELSLAKARAHDASRTNEHNA
ncbi:MAG: hypothetical protein AAF291_03545 [Pseudomonadota bacterium]